MKGHEKSVREQSSSKLGLRQGACRDSKAYVLDSLAMSCGAKAVAAAKSAMRRKIVLIMVTNQEVALRVIVTNTASGG